jgi:hypothetical protein
VQRRIGYRLVAARNGATGEVKYFLTNATGESVKRLLRRRRTPEGEHVDRVIRYHQRRNKQAADSHKKRLPELIPEPAL